MVKVLIIMILSKFHPFLNSILNYNIFFKILQIHRIICLFYINSPFIHSPLSPNETIFSLCPSSSLVAIFPTNQNNLFVNKFNMDNFSFSSTKLSIGTLENKNYFGNIKSINNFKARKFM